MSLRHHLANFTVFLPLFLHVNEPVVTDLLEPYFVPPILCL